MTQVPSSPPGTRSSSPYTWAIYVLAGVIALVVLYRLTGNEEPAVQSGNATRELRKLAVVPPFALTERNGKQITNRDLAGKIKQCAIRYLFSSSHTLPNY